VNAIYITSQSIDPSCATEDPLTDSQNESPHQKILSIHPWKRTKNQSKLAFQTKTTES